MKDASDGLLNSTSAVLGADNLLQLLKNYARTQNGSKKSITVGIVGYPNVGKSSVINSLKRSSVVKVGGTAGVTKAMQEIILDKNVRLLDSPGVVFDGKSEDPSVVLRNAVKIENIKDPHRVLTDMCKVVPLVDLAPHFLGNGDEEECGGAAWGAKKVWEDLDLRSFLVKVATTRGLLKRGGAMDLSRAACGVLQEIACGKFRYHTLPPVEQADQVAPARLVIVKPGVSEKRFDYEGILKSAESKAEAAEMDARDRGGKEDGGEEGGGEGGDVDM